MSTIFFLASLITILTLVYTLHLEQFLMLPSSRDCGTWEIPTRIQGDFSWRWKGGGGGGGGGGLLKNSMHRRVDYTRASAVRLLPGFPMCRSQLRVAAAKSFLFFSCRGGGRRIHCENCIFLSRSHTSAGQSSHALPFSRKASARKRREGREGRSRARRGL